MLADSQDTDYKRYVDELCLIPQLIKATDKDPQFTSFQHYISLLRKEFENFKADRNQALTLLSKLALLSLRRLIRHSKIQTGPGNRDSLILIRFRALLEKHYQARWPVSRYAQALYISTSTLNRLCHQRFNENPKAIIQTRVLVEAKRRLFYTQQTMEEIAYTLGFKDQAYFSRFFKKLTGMTAGSYRKSDHEKIVSD